MEEVNARASNNKVLFRFGILEPKSYDLVDIVVRHWKIYPQPALCPLPLTI